MFKKKNKYFNIKCTFDGIKFDSKAEMQRYHFLKNEEKLGLIKDLKLQPKFFFFIDGRPLKGKDLRSRHICYIADFMYIRKGKKIVEDVKSRFTADNKVFRIKKALFDTTYGHEGYELVCNINKK